MEQQQRPFAYWKDESGAPTYWSSVWWWWWWMAHETTTTPALPLEPPACLPTMPNGWVTKNKTRERKAHRVADVGLV